MMQHEEHVPVLMAEVVAALAPQADEVLVDGTFGRGGYTRHIMAAAPCTVFGIDRDPQAVAVGERLAAESADRFHMVKGRFSEMEALLAEKGVTSVDGVTLDLGVSSPQLDQAERGFSFQHDGPLDMRMGDVGQTAADLVNTLSEAELENMIYAYGEERKSRRIAKFIVNRRAEEPFARTADLAAVVARAAPSGGKVHPATRTFQALRIAVNEELDELSLALGAAERLLVPGGRLAIVTFHSLEDRIVKRFLQERCGETPRGSRHLPMPMAGDDAEAPTFSLEFRGAKAPTKEEISRNPRARSAKLRAARRTAAPAWPTRGGRA